MNGELAEEIDSSGLVSMKDILGDGLIKDIEEITDIDYSDDLISMNDVVYMIKNIVTEYYNLREELEDTIEDRDENYTKIDEPCWEDIARERGY